MKSVVFHGPSISTAEVDRLIAATHAPPIRRGDLDAVDGYDVVVILDGDFGQSHSVSPKEILRTIEKGVIVIGASSMGALRASELDRMGMIGIGWIYDRFRRCAVRRDDDVALVYSPIDFKPMTVPVIDVDYWTSRLLADRLVTRRDKARLVRMARSIFFAERTEEQLMKAFGEAFGDRRVAALLEATGGEMPNIKMLDAQAAIRFAASTASGRSKAMSRGK